MHFLKLFVFNYLVEFLGLLQQNGQVFLFFLGQVRLLLQFLVHLLELLLYLLQLEFCILFIHFLLVSILFNLLFLELNLEQLFLALFL